MEIRKLRHFVAVADTLNFRLAAERLHLSQPALTRSIAGLEKRLGLRLFHRDTRRVVLTEDGADLLSRARQVLAGVDDFTFAAHSLSAGAEDVLRVGTYGNGLAELTDPVLQEFRRRYPATKLQVHDADFHRGIQPLLEGRHHVALVRAPSALVGLHVVPVFVEPTDVLLAGDHRLAGVDSVGVEELFDESWVTFPPSIPGTWAAHWLAEDQRGGADVVVGKYARSEYELFAGVAYEGQVGLAPRSSLRLRPHPGIVAVPVHGVGPSTAAVAMPALGGRPAAAALAEVAAELARGQLALVEDAVLPDA